MVLDATTTRTRRTQGTRISCELARLGPVELADLLLTALARRHVSAVSIEPRGDRHLVRVDLCGTTTAVGALDGGIGDAACARLALVAGIDLGASDQRLGRAQVRIGDEVVDLLIAVRPTAAGLGVAVHRIGGGATSAAGELGGEASNRYRLLDELGHGGMGVVYRAEHVVLQKPVAIKVLRPGLADDPVLATQFVLEARAACRARHPGIVDVTDFGRLGDGRAFIVMELVEGETLAHVLLEGGPLPPRRAVALARRIANALRAAGDAGIVHRDLKPSNVFVLPDDRVKIGDFGVACIVHSAHAASGRVVGTVGYMAPEQARGESVDARADLYALGCVLYEMLVGRAPFAGNAAEILKAHASAAVPPIDSPHGPIPPELGRVIQRAMAKRPEERYPAASDMIADLTHAAEALGPVGWRRWQA